MVCLDRPPEILSEVAPLSHRTINTRCETITKKTFESPLARVVKNLQRSFHDRPLGEEGNLGKFFWVNHIRSRFDQRRSTIESSQKTQRCRLMSECRVYCFMFTAIFNRRDLILKKRDHSPEFNRRKKKLPCFSRHNCLFPHHLSSFHHWQLRQYYLDNMSTGVLFLGFQFA